MNNSIELHIKGGIDTATETFEFERLELFDFEDINVTSKIQDIKDISKVFTEYSREFTIPATASNNRVFKHYYNFLIEYGFDARFKLDAFIKVDGYDYKKGKISLLSVAMMNQLPKSYKIVFYGETVSLKDILGDDELKDLGTKADSEDKVEIMEALSFTHTAQNVGTHFTDGYYINSSGVKTRRTSSTDPIDFCFPFISAQSYYFYDDNVPAASPSEGSTQSRTIKASTSSDTTPRGINWLDLKPAIKVDLIMTAIEQRYGLTLNRNYFLSDDNYPYSKLMMWMHREKGYIRNQINSESNTYNISDWEAINSPLWTDGDDLTINKYTFSIPPFTGDIMRTIMNISVTPASPNESYEIRVSTGIGADFVAQCLGSESVDVIYKVGNDLAPNEGVYTPEVSIISFGSTTSYSISLEIKTQYLSVAAPVEIWTDIDTYDFKPLGAQTFPTGKLDIASQMPKMKIIDFLTSLFKMYNLTAYYSNGEIVLESLDEYYKRGDVHDITQYIDTSKSIIKRSKLYSEVNMTFEESKTLAANKSNELTGDEFGNERLASVFKSRQLRDLLDFDGGTYDVKAKFEKMMFERMTNQTTEVATEFQWGWSVNKDQNPTVMKPMLFYPEMQTLSPPITSVSFDLSLYEDFQVVNLVSFPEYIKPMNVEFLSGHSTHFGSEFNEWNGLPISASLVNEYWMNYILTIYDKKSRIIETTAYLPAHLITSIELNDELIIRGQRYRINSLDINLNKGKVELELFNDLGYYD